MRSAARRRFARALAVELTGEHVEYFVAFGPEPTARIDGGLGELAIAAIAAQSSPAARDLEAAVWARRAIERDIATVAVMCVRDPSEDRIDAHARLVLAIQRAREAR